MEKILVYLDENRHELNNETIEVLDGVFEFYENFGNSIESKTLNESLALLKIEYDKLKVSTRKTLINRVDTEKLNYFERYPLQGENIPEKIKICRLTHNLLGFPAYYENFKNYTPLKLIKQIEQKVNLSRSTIYNIVYLTITIDKLFSNLEKKTDVK